MASADKLAAVLSWSREETQHAAENETVAKGYEVFNNLLKHLTQPRFDYVSLLAISRELRSFYELDEGKNEDLLRRYGKRRDVVVVMYSYIRRALKELSKETLGDVFLDQQKAAREALDELVRWCKDVCDDEDTAVKAAEAGVIGDLCAALTALRHGNPLCMPRICLTIDLLWRIARYESTTSACREAGAVDALLPLLGYHASCTREMAMMMLCHLVDEDSSHKVVMRDGGEALRVVIQFFTEAVRDGQEWCFRFPNDDDSTTIIHAMDFCQALGALARVDDGKRWITDWQGIPPIVTFLEYGRNSNEQVVACEALWQLSFHPAASVKILRTKAVELLETYATSPDVEVKKAASGALWQLRKPTSDGGQAALEPADEADPYPRYAEELVDEKREEVRWVEDSASICYARSPEYVQEVRHVHDTRTYGCSERQTVRASATTPAVEKAVTITDEDWEDRCVPVEQVPQQDVSASVRPGAPLSPLFDMAPGGWVDPYAVCIEEGRTIPRDSSELQPLGASAATPAARVEKDQAEGGQDGPRSLVPGVDYVQSVGAGGEVLGTFLPRRDKVVPHQFTATVTCQEAPRMSRLEQRQVIQPSEFQPQRSEGPPSIPAPLRPPPPIPRRQSAPAPPKSPKDKLHIMLSYQTTFRPSVLKVRDVLKSEGYTTWMDVDQMGAQIYQSMADAVEQSSCVLVFFSESYKNSPACRSEASYARDLSKKLIPVKVENGYKATSWLGFLIGGMKYYDLTGKKPYDVQLQMLLSHVNRLELEKKQTAQQEPEIKREVTSHVSSGAPGVTSWSVAKASAHLAKHQLDTNTRTLKTVDGGQLSCLRVMRKEAPEFFYKYVKGELRLVKLSDLAALLQALDTLPAH